MRFSFISRSGRRFEKLLLIFALLAYPVSSRIIDRLAITIGNQTVTELDIDEELRITALLNHQAILRDVKSRRDAASRLVQQFLIKREMDISRYPGPEPAEIDTYADQIEKEFGGSLPLAETLRTYGLDTFTLKKHLALQLTTLRFIEFRFRPDLSVSDAELSAYRNRRQAENKMSRQTDATLRQLIVEERTDEALNAWLEASRRRINIVYVNRAME